MPKQRITDLAGVITSIKHPAVAAARRGLGQSRPSDDSLFLIEGREIISQALAARAPVRQVFALHPPEPGDESLLQEVREAGVDCRLVTKGVFGRILGLGYETSTRIAATVSAAPLPGSQALELIDSESCLLVGEAIQDPRNVGVLIRSADGWRLKLAVFTGDSADPYSRPAVRSTTGSILRIPLAITDDLIGFLRGLREKAVRIIGTSAHAATPCWEADLSPPCAILLGNETVGLSAAAKEACDLLVTIPMSGGAHSFNVTVAAGVVLYEAARQRAQARPARG